MTQDSIVPAREQGGTVTPPSGQPLVSNRKDARMDTTQAPHCDPVLHCSLADADGIELLPRDQPFLASSNIGQRHLRMRPCLNF